MSESVTEPREPASTEDEAAKIAAAHAAIDDAGNWARRYRRETLRSAWFWRGLFIGLIAGCVEGLWFEDASTAWEKWDKIGKAGGIWGWWLFIVLLPASMAAMILVVAYYLTLYVAWIGEHQTAITTALKHEVLRFREWRVRRMAARIESGNPAAVATAVRELQETDALPSEWKGKVDAIERKHLAARAEGQSQTGGNLNVPQDSPSSGGATASRQSSGQPRPGRRRRLPGRRRAKMGGFRRAWRLMGAVTDLIASAGCIVFGVGLLSENGIWAQWGIVGLALLAAGLWFALKGFSKTRAWWLRAD